MLNFLEYEKSDIYSVSSTSSQTPTRGDSIMPLQLHRVETKRLGHSYSGILRFLRNHQRQQITYYRQIPHTPSKETGQQQTGQAVRMGRNN